MALLRLSLCVQFMGDFLPAGVAHTSRSALAVLYQAAKFRGMQRDGAAHPRLEGTYARDRRPRARYERRALASGRLTEAEDGALTRAAGGLPAGSQYVREEPTSRIEDRCVPACA